MSNLEKRVYKSYAFTKDELEKRNINSLIYKELSEKYKISHSSRQYNSILKGMEDVKKAMEPLFTTRPELDRSGMGFSFMEAFMDQVEVSSKPGKGTIVKMQKTIGKGRKVWTTQSL